MAWTLTAAQYSSAKWPTGAARHATQTWPGPARSQGPGGHGTRGVHHGKRQPHGRQDSLASLSRRSSGPKTFSTGSKGFYGQDKITVGGKRYQAQVSAILVGSKGDPRARVHASADQAQAALVTDLIDKGVEPKSSSSGKTGFRTQGKVEIGGQTYQASAQAVLLAK